MKKTYSENTRKDGKESKNYMKIKWKESEEEEEKWRRRRERLRKWNKAEIRETEERIKEKKSKDNM